MNTNYPLSELYKAKCRIVVPEPLSRNSLWRLRATISLMRPVFETTAALRAVDHHGTAVDSFITNPDQHTRIPAALLALQT